MLTCTQILIQPPSSFSHPPPPPFISANEFVSLVLRLSLSHWADSSPRTARERLEYGGVGNRDPNMRTIGWVLPKGFSKSLKTSDNPPKGGFGFFYSCQLPDAGWIVPGFTSGLQATQTGRGRFGEPTLWNTMPVELSPLPKFLAPKFPRQIFPKPRTSIPFHTASLSC